MTSPRTKAPRLGTVASVLSLFLASLALEAQNPTLPSPLYAIDNGDNELAVFGLKSQTVRVIGPVGPGALALAFCPSGGLVPYTIASPFDPNNAQLAILNLATGAAKLVGSSLPAGQTLDIMGMACSRNGTLYAIGQFDTGNPDFNSLYKVDRRTGQVTRIGSTGVLDPSDASGASGFLMALAFAPDGKLYGVNSASTLFSIDPSSGAATKVADLYTAPATRLVGVMGLAIDGRGTFYVADWVPASRVYAVDTTTGLATPILNTGLAFVHNIAFRIPF